MARGEGFFLLLCLSCAGEALVTAT
jgi:hypothetical protein